LLVQSSATIVEVLLWTASALFPDFWLGPIAVLTSAKLRQNSAQARTSVFVWFSAPSPARCHFLYWLAHVYGLNPFSN
jgi:hypothetical protein